MSTATSAQPNHQDGAPARPATVNHQSDSKGQAHSGSDRSIYSIYGAMGGRPRVQVDLDRANQLIAEGTSIRATARRLGVGEGTLRQRLGLVNVRGQGEISPTPRGKPLGRTI